MSRADDLRARAARVASHAATPPDVPTPRSAAPRVAPVRITVDLDPARHRRLKRWCADTADDFGLPQVHYAAVVRVLLDELAADPVLAAKVRGTLSR